MRTSLLFSFIVPVASLLSKNFVNRPRLYSTKLAYKKINAFEPKNPHQEEYMKMLDSNNYDLIIATGSAGTGKTLLACQSAVKELFDGSKEKIIITRPIVPVEEDLGYLPGTINKKMDPWTRPIMDTFNDFHSKNNIKNMLKDNTIEISPLAFMRGRTFKNAFIIADEMQNCSPNQMLMLLTRLGENSKLVITGDLNQCDKENSGLKDLIERLHLYYYPKIKLMKKDNIGMIEFNSDDVLRSEMVSKILKIYNE